MRKLAGFFLSGAAALTLLVSAPPVSAQTMLELSINGDEGQIFSGDCYLLAKSGVIKRHRVSGQVPARMLFPTKAVRCNLEKSSAKGVMIVALKRGAETEFLQKSRYPFRWIVISSKGPWGAAGGGAYAARPTYR